MASSSLTKSFEGLNKLVKLVLIFFFGWIISGVYRIIRYTETKNTVTLVAGVLALFTGVGNFIFEIVDFITELLNDKITVLAD
ncbi:MAG: hypothetical protein IJW48_04435 [Clostridia bacterium]|nr:hypothetical protein [Clostridia bacterium]